MKTIYSRVLIGEHFICGGSMLFRKVSGGAKIVGNTSRTGTVGSTLEDKEFSPNREVEVVDPLRWFAENTPTTKLHFSPPEEVKEW